MLMLAWAILCDQLLLLSSATLSGHALESSGVAILAIALWAVLRRARTATRLLDRRATRVACGVVVALAVAALAFSPGGFWSFALFAVAVFGASELVFASLRKATAFEGRALCETAAGALCIAGGLHLVSRLFAGAIGSFANVGTYSQVSTVMLALLPLAAVIIGAIPNGDDDDVPDDVPDDDVPDDSVPGNSTSFAKPEEAEVSAAARSPRLKAGFARAFDLRSGASASAPPEELGANANASTISGDPRFNSKAPVWAESLDERNESHVFPGAGVLVALLALASFVVVFFAGAVTTPFQVDMLFCSDCGAAVLFAGGIVLLIASGRLHVAPAIAIGVLAVVALACALGAMLAFATSSDPIALVPLAVVQASCGCLVAALWATFAYFGQDASRAWRFAIVFLAVAVPLRFFGMGSKQLVGLDAHTVVAYVLVGMVVLVGALFVAVFGVVLSAQNALRAAEREKARATSKVVESMRHDAGYAADALHQVHLDILKEHGLSEREAEIAAMQLAGNTMDAIGEKAGISPNTVRFHMKNVYQKVGVNGKQALRQKISEEMEKR